VLYRGPSGLEILARQTLDQLGVPYLEQFQIDAFFADFLLYERYVVEIDGKYWHELKKESDRFRDRILRQRGFIVFRIPDETLLANPEGAIRDVLRQIPL
jgi:very-short-patch-repair endonuclease